MTFPGLFDHRIRFWRPVTVKDGAGVRETYTPINDEPASNNAKFTEPDFSLAVEGSGDRPIGNCIISTLPNITLRERDFAQILGGPDAPAVARLVSVNYPRGHHMKAIAERWSQPVEFPDA